MRATPDETVEDLQGRASHGLGFPYLWLDATYVKAREGGHGEWPAIEDYWVDVVLKQSGDGTCQWISPSEHLSYQMPEKPFEISEEDFRKTALDYLLFQCSIDAKEFESRLTSATLYSSTVADSEDAVTITIPKVGEGE